MDDFQANLDFPQSYEQAGIYEPIKNHERSLIEAAFDCSVSQWRPITLETQY